MMNTEQFIFSNLARHPEYYDDVISLIEKEFHYHSEFHFEIDFAPLVSPSNFENCLIVIDKKSNQVIAHLGYTLREMIKNNIKLPVCFIGGIVTHKDFRGKNLFRQLMNQAIEKNHHRVGLFFLWSDIQGLYEKFNFYLSGGLIETGKNIITKDNLPKSFLKTTFSNLTEKEFNEIKNLYANSIENKYFTLLRQESHWAIIRQMKSVDLFIEKNSDGKIITYICQGKGRDLQGVIHEFGSQNLESTINQFEQFKLWIPEYYGENYPNANFQFTAYLRIGSRQIISEFLKKITENEFNLNCELDDEIKFIFKNKNYKVSELDLLHYLFGPNILSEFTKFKLSPFIAGTDSI